MSTTRPVPSFNQIFEEAAAEFSSITSQNVRGIGGLTLEDVLERLGARSAGQDEDAQSQKEKTKIIVSRVLKGLQILNGFAAQAASSLFPNSNVCFDAVGWLLKIPETISKLYAAIDELFCTIESYLVRFGILKRAEDQGGGIAPEMIVSTGLIMKRFVRICAYCYKAWTGGRFSKVKLTFKAVFLDEGSKVKKELDEFEKLTRQQEAITGVATLEAVLRNSKSISNVTEIVRNIDWALVTVSNKVDAVADDVGMLAKEAVDKSLKEEAAKGLSEIIRLVGLGNDSGKAIYEEQERVREVVGLGNDSGKAIYEEQERVREEVARKLVRDSGQWLKDLPAYQNWRSQSSSDHILVLRGSSGCGKHFLASRIGDDFDKQDLGEARYSVGYYHFSKYQADNSDKDKDLGLDTVAGALKIMAWQIAKKNLPYRRDLLSSCRSTDETILRGEKPEIESLWSALKFASAASKSSYVFVLIFDGFEQLDHGAASQLVRVLTLTKQEIANATDRVRLRILITGTDEPAPNVKMRLLHQVPDVVVHENNLSDIAAFIQKRMDNPVFANLNNLVDKGYDADLTKAVREDFPSIVRGNFSDVLAKIERLDAILNEVDEDEQIPSMKKVLREESGVIRFKNATSAITDLNKTLTPKDIKQLNMILQWIVYAHGSHSLNLLAAVIYRAGLHSRSQPELFAQKIRSPTKFGRILNVERVYSEDYIEIDEQVLKHLKDQVAGNSDGNTEQDVNTASVTMTITFKHATQKDVESFFWTLSQNTTADFGVFPAPKKIVNKERIYIDPAESLSSIVEQALDVLTDEPDINTEAMAYWAAVYLCDHLNTKRSNRDQDLGNVTFRNKPRILRRLVSLLTDTSLTLKHWSLASYIMRSEWLNEDVTDSIAAWLHDEETANQLKPKHKRRLERLLSKNEGKGGFWKPLTVEIAKDWLLRDDGDYQNSYDWIDGYICMQKRSENLASENSEAPGRSEAPETSPEVQEDDTEPAVLRRARTTNFEDDRPALQRTRTDLATGTVGIQRAMTDIAEGAVGTSDVSQVASPEQELSKIAIINRAAEWAQKELSFLPKSSSTWHYRLAMTFNDNDEVDEAIKLLEDTKQRFPREWKIYKALTDIYERKGRSKLALRNAAIAVEILESGDEPDENCDKRSESYSHLGTLQADAHMIEDARQSFGKALELRPNNYLLRAKYLKALEQNGRQDEIVAFFSNAQNQASKEGNLTELPHIFYSLSNSGMIDCVTNIFSRMVRCGKVSLALESIENALEHAKRQKSANARQTTNLEFLKTNAMALLPHGDDSLHQVFEQWTRISKSYSSLEDLNWQERMLYWRTDQLRGAYCLHQAQQYGLPEHVTHLNNIGALHKEWGVMNTQTYLARYKLGQDRKSEARALFATRMRDAFETLSNEDVTDDWVGYSWMAEIFEKLDEDENAWTAWSLIGPENQNPGSGKEGDHQENDGQPDGPPPTPGENTYRSGNWGQYCDGGCGKTWTFADDFVRCKVCPQTTFCRDCFNYLRQGSPSFYWCNPKHAFLEVPAWPTIDWPLGRERVCVGGWARPDGDVVNIDVWLDRIRKDWDIAEQKPYDWQKKSEE